MIISSRPSSSATFLSSESVLYDLQYASSTGVLLRLTSNELTENFAIPQLISDVIPNDILLYDNETKLYIPGCEFTI